MATEQIYREIAQRTGGNIYLGVVGPVRTGKSTFIKRFVEQALLPRIQEESLKERTRDEMPQSAAGRTIMTTEPKFVPEQAIRLELPQGGSFQTRLIDCVGYMVPGALGNKEDSKPRMVKTPWSQEPIPFDEAAEMGTQKVIRDHSTIGIVMTTDGSISDIPRDSYLEAERRVIGELKDLGKPFLILLNCTQPETEQARQLAREMEAEYGQPVTPVNCLDLDGEAIGELLGQVLYQFPIRQIGIKMPRWINCLDSEHWLQKKLFQGLLELTEELNRMGDAKNLPIPAQEEITSLELEGMDLGTGNVTLRLELAGQLFYRIISESTGLEIRDESQLMPCVLQMARDKKAYDRVKNALEQVEATGYGIVMPEMEELQLEEPVIVNQGGKYGVRLSASAPSIHMLRADIDTQISPIVGTEKQSEELVMSLLRDFEEDPAKLWQSNIFGKSLHELVNEGLQSKLLHIPADARTRMQETLEQVINEGCAGLICIIL